MNNRAIFIIFLCACAITVLGNPIKPKPKSKLKPKPKIAIIGGGIGGTSCAAMLTENNVNANIDIYEQESIIGGRIKTLKHNSEDFETGGVIHSRNQYLKSLLTDSNYDVNTWDTKEMSAIYNGKSVHLINSSNNLTTYKKLTEFIQNTLEDFDQIYELQKIGLSFQTVRSLLKAINPKFEKYLCENTEKLLKNDVGCNEDEKILAEALLRVNYGQTLKAHAFAGWTAMSFSELSGELSTISGGAKQVAEELLENSYANLIHGIRVTKIEKKEDGKISVYFFTNGGEESFKNYDFVVVAAPLIENRENIDFLNFEGDIPINGNFHKTISTLVDGKLKKNYFKNDSLKVENVNQIINIENDSFDSMQKVQPVSNVSSFQDIIWLINSSKELSKPNLSEMFKSSKVMLESEFFAYPEYSEVDCKKDLSFVLGPGLYYINAIEWAASSMEMSMIGAKNVALLIEKEISK